MHRGFASLILRLLPAPAVKPASPPRRRQLVAETLESRFALSTLGDGTILPDPPAPATDPAVILVDSTSPTADTGSTGAEPSDPPPTDPPPTNPPDSGDPPATNAPPVIHDFSYSINNGWCTLIGWVSDDQSPGGDLIVFSGAIQGETIVNPDFHFSFSFQVSMDFQGEISAVAFDFTGLASQEALVMI